MRGTLHTTRDSNISYLVHGQILNSPMELLQIFDGVWFLVAFAMSAALTKSHPDLAGWGNVSRSIAWPVTLLEVQRGDL